jgi:prepilin-type N-terminal cleavage/methylation domain-containing protein
MHRTKANDAGPTPWPYWAAPRGWRGSATGTACVSKRSLVHGGFTLVEVLAAVVLLSIGLLAVLSAGQAARETQQRAVYMAAGRTIAQTKVDEARATHFDQLDQLVGSYSDPSLPPHNTVSTSVSPYTNPMGQADPNLGRISVTVTWPEGASTRSIVYETLIANKN